MNRALADNSVAARFSAAAGSYEDQAQIQRLVADRLLAGVRACDRFERILEIGCGTGTLTRGLCRRFPGATIEAVDIASAMIEQAKKRLGDEERVRWHAIDARHFCPVDTYPLIISSSALHWMRPLPETLRSLTRLLEPGGGFHAALMVDGIFPELEAARRQAAPAKPSRIRLPEVSEVLGAFAAAGLKVARSFEEHLPACYESAAAFLKSLNAQGVTGASAGARTLLNRSELARLVEEYDRRFASPSGGVVATYRVLYVRAGKELK